jgi:ABC-2 type transport system ATP-binding protein
MTSGSAITTSGLTKHYPGVAALTGLDLDVPAGSIYGFLGPNGAGKTTAIKLLAGLARPTAGSATVAGIPLEAGEAYKRSIGYLGQEPRFYGWMTGRETLRYAASFYPWVTDPVEDRIAAMLDLVGIRDAAERRTNTYSGGMRQRLGIAQALVGRPQVLLLDEPVSALDPIGRKAVLDLMAGLKGEATIFYSTHILDDVQRVSDYVAILDHGRLVRAAPTAELLASFTRGQLRVTLVGGGGDERPGLASLAGVVSAEATDAGAGSRTYVLTVAPDAIGAVQRAVTDYATAQGLTLTENSPVHLDLEDVFLRLIDPKELAA